MLRYIRYAILLVLTVVLVIVAFANREWVSLRLLPDEMDTFWPVGRVVELPLFVVILAAVAVGVVLGFTWEWLREHRYRAAASHERRAKEKLAREVEKVKGNQGDEVLKLLDGSRS